MPRSVQEILDHADKLAKRFEDYEPTPDDEVAVADAQALDGPPAPAAVDGESARSKAAENR